MSLPVSTRSLVLAFVCWLTATTASAEVSKINASRQWGLGYLQLMVMEEKKLVEKHAAAMDLGDITVEWSTIGSAGLMNTALISGSVDLIAVGPVGLATLWARTRGKQDIRGLAGLNALPLYLLTRNPAVKSVRDFTTADRIAVPSVQVSTQAVMLQITAAKLYGKENFTRFDSLTVGLSHPNALTALLAGTGEVTGYFSAPPFQYRALSNPGIRRIMSAAEALGEPMSFSNVVMRGTFCRDNPRTCRAIYSALEEATRWINDNRDEAAALYGRVSGDVMPRTEIVKMLADPEFEFTLRPMAIKQIADFLHDAGRLDARPNSWRDLYFDYVKELNGT